MQQNYVHSVLVEGSSGKKTAHLLGGQERGHHLDRRGDAASALDQFMVILYGLRVALPIRSTRSSVARRGIQAQFQALLVAVSVGAGTPYVAPKEIHIKNILPTVHFSIDIDCKTDQ